MQPCAACRCSIHSPVAIPLANPNVSFGILHQDEHVMVVHKRAGLVTQPGKGHESDSILNGICAHQDGRIGKILANLGATRDYGLLHRLDRETSGLLVVALTADAYDKLREQFEARTVKKFYWAVTVKAPANAQGIINKPIMETEPKRIGEKKLAKISSRGKDSATAYRVISMSPNGAVLECRPLSGRLHQVRVHLEAIGCPIVGDGLYATPAVAALAPRLALHAWRLAFDHPITGEPIDCRSEFPKELKGTLKKLKLDTPEEL